LYALAASQSQLTVDIAAVVYSDCHVSVKYQTEKCVLLIVALIMHV